MPDLRKTQRISENHPINWSTHSGDSSGKARIRNLSSTGMMVEVPTTTSIKEDATLVFDSGITFENYIPREGQVVWRKSKNGLSDRQLLGIQFVEPTGQAGEYLNDRIVKKTKQQKVVGWLKRIASVLLIISSIAIIGFTAWLTIDVQLGLQNTNNQLEVMVDKQSALTRNFANLYVEFRNLYNVTKEQLDAATEELKTTKQLYSESQQMLQQVTDELNSTRGILAKTQGMINGMLTELGVDLDTPTLDEAQMLDKQTQFETAVNSLQERNQRLGEELNLIKEQLMYYAGEVKDIDEAQKWFKMYRDRVKKVKQRIKVFRQQTQEIKISAQGELDRIQSEIGNNGYMTKDGQAVKVDQEKYDSVTIDQVLKERQPTPAAETEPQKVNIDVNFFK